MKFSLLKRRNNEWIKKNTYQTYYYQALAIWSPINILEHII